MEARAWQGICSESGGVRGILPQADTQGAELCDDAKGEAAGDDGADITQLLAWGRRGDARGQ